MCLYWSLQLHIHMNQQSKIIVTDVNGRLLQLTWDSGFHLLMPVSDADPVAMYAYTYGWLYTKNTWFFTRFFSLTCKFCCAAQRLWKLARIQLLLFAPHGFVAVATGDLCHGNVAFRFWDIGRATQIILIIKSFLEIKLVFLPCFEKGLK